MSSTALLFVSLNLIMLVLGQLLWKYGLQSLGGFSIMGVVTSIPIWAGIFIYALATLVYLKVLSLVPLSVAYPIQSLCYVGGMVGAYFLFGETINLQMIIGMGVILAGVLLIANA